MCRGNDHGGRRCPNDTSEARRLRRKLAEANKNSTATQPVLDGIKPNRKGLPELHTVEEMRQESELLNTLLHQPILEDMDAQDLIDDELEKRVTNLGMALGNLAEERANFNYEDYLKERDTVDPQFTAASKELDETVHTCYILERQIKKITYDKWFDKKFQDVEPKPEKENPLLEEEFSEYVSNLNQDFEAALEAREHAQEMWELWDKADRAKSNLLDTKKNKALVIAYKSVIADMRPVGGDIIVADTSNEETKNIYIQTVGKDYPTQWLEQSGAAEKMRLRQQYGARAHYNSRNKQDDLFGGEEAPDRGIMIFPITKEQEILKKLGESEGKIFPSRVRSFHNSGILSKAYYLETRIVFDPTVDGNQNKDGSPQDKTGWHYGYTLNPKGTGLLENKTWYKIPKEVNVISAEILIGSNDPESVYYHEFCHRAEHTVPDYAITRQEEAFLRRRTTNSQGQQEELDYLYPPKDNSLVNAEVGRRDKFIESYMGKEYLASDHREVLSVGSEAIFTGKYGALAGVRESPSSIYNPDLDYRAFVLGVFASA